MNEEMKQCIKVARRAVVNLYVAGTNGRFFWPYRLQPADEATPSVRRKSFKYILDSGFDNQNGITNEDLITEAKRRDPTYVIPNDEISDEDTSSWEAIRETAARVEQFLDLVDERGLNCKVLVPLQPPYDLHFEHLRVNHPRQARRRHFALGGMKDSPPERQLRHIRRFRAEVGWDAYAHGLGFGASRPMIEALREEPALLDSVDVSTPQQHAITGQIAGASRRPVYYGPAKGKDITTTTGKATVAELTDIARMLAPSITTDDDLEVNWESLPHDPPEDEKVEPASNAEAVTARESG